MLATRPKPMTLRCYWCSVPDGAMTDRQTIDPSQLVLSLLRDPSELALLSSSVKSFAVSNHISGQSCANIQLISEELFINCITHNESAIGPVEIRLSLSDLNLELSIKDHALEPFDPVQYAKEQLPQRGRQAHSAGHGLILVAAIASDLRYQFRGGISIIEATIAL